MSNIFKKILEEKGNEKQAVAVPEKVLILARQEIISLEALTGLRLQDWILCMENRYRPIS